MGGFLDSVKKSVLGKEVSLPICFLSRTKTIHVFYTYYEAKPQSHRLEFRKGKRTRFEIFLPNHGQNIEQLCSAVERREYCRASGKTVFGFWPRLILRLTAGELISSQDISIGPGSEIHTRLGEASSTYRYRLAYCQKGAQKSMVLVSTLYSSQSSKYRKGKSAEFNWLKLSREEFRTLAEHLQSFIGSIEFANAVRGCSLNIYNKAEMLEAGN